MSQSDLDIANISRSLFRAEVNAALQALASNSSAATEPSTTYPFQPWADTTSGLMKIRNEANNGWIDLYALALGGLAQLGGMNLTGAINEERSTVAATATTTPIWDTGTGNIQDWTGTPTITDFPDAPQAGARRVAYPAAGTVITDNANIETPSSLSYTVRLGDEITIIAKTTSTFKVVIKPKAIQGSELLAIYTASSSAQIDITEGFDGNYAELLFVFENILPATNAVNFTARISTDGGASFISTATYFSSVLVNNGATAIGASSEAIAAWNLGGSTLLSNSAGETLNGEMRLFSPATASSRPYSTSHTTYRSSAGNNSVCLRGNFNTNTNANAIRFFMDSGNIASGKIYVYGLRK